WKLQNGLVLFLPHGYEGQGAEHSSGRMERFLQLCAKDNMFVADVTSPANFFHLLRRQMKAKYRKPFVLFTPKSLLRQPKVHTTNEARGQGGLQMLIHDPTAKAAKVKSLMLRSGKLYYVLFDKKEKNTREGDVALVRLEQLFPRP